jgi:hypothetical protein
MAMMHLLAGMSWFTAVQHRKNAGTRILSFGANSGGSESGHIQTLRVRFHDGEAV